MIKRLIPLVLLLTGCKADLSDLEKHISDVRANTAPYVKPLPEIKEFIHIAYRPRNKRSPFIPPKENEIIVDEVVSTNCKKPDQTREKEALEQYALENIKLKGLMSSAGVDWGLVETNDGRLYRVKKGQHMGLFHGKVDKVERDTIYLTELLPDGTGCWQLRPATIANLNVSQ